MRKHLLGASATLALALLAVSGCGGTPTTASASPTSSCVNATATHHAYVVVKHLSGTAVQRCVGFAGDTIDAQTLMDQSGIEYQTQTFSFGKAVCQVDSEPTQYTACFATSGPNWSLFVETGGTWMVAQTGYSQVTLHDKEALGWLYTQDQSPSPPPLAKEG